MKVDPEILAALRGTDLFAGVDDRTLKAVAGQVHHVVHEPGSEITEEGGQAIGLHVISAGTARVTVGSEERPGLGPGDYFGEISMIDGLPRSATVTAETEVTTMSLPFWSFRPLLDREPELCKALLNVLCARLRAAEHPGRPLPD